jgi:hypothetical protein
VANSPKRSRRHRLRRRVCRRSHRFRISCLDFRILSHDRLKKKQQTQTQNTSGRPRFHEKCAGRGLDSWPQKTSFEIFPSVDPKLILFKSRHQYRGRRGGSPFFRKHCPKTPKDLTRPQRCFQDDQNQTYFSTTVVRRAYNSLHTYLVLSYGSFIFYGF